jgi:protoheme IX farnesyltransferase
LGRGRQVEATAVTALMGATAARFFVSPTLETARTMFRASLIHLPLLMAAMVLHRVPQQVRLTPT